MKNKILPIIAGVIAIIAILIIILVPKDNKTEKVSKASQNTSSTQKTTKTNAKTSSKLATLDEEGNVIINKDDVSSEKILFLKYSENSKIELIAVKDKDGNINVALGTCQSCNGSPKAYYTQYGNLLKCNNCGLTFPLSVIGVNGEGCHPIMINEEEITRTENEVKISKKALLQNEKLFEKVASH